MGDDSREDTGAAHQEAEEESEGFSTESVQAETQEGVQVDDATESGEKGESKESSEASGVLEGAASEEEGSEITASEQEEKQEEEIIADTFPSDGDPMNERTQTDSSQVSSNTKGKDQDSIQVHPKSTQLWSNTFLVLTGFFFT